MIMFQSSPALKDRCNLATAPGPGGFIKFQSSPALKDRCNAGDVLDAQLELQPFQSSPALKDRCNALELARALRPCHVSILTGLERPVQRKCCRSASRLRSRFNPHRP